mmetsp:Transcript_10353/g.24197  ORF Transcript_10353/g.24197 Transcript_10353/m.24197 type:complete len:259 (+) Transcript_10353:2053-2829(+)
MVWSDDPEMMRLPSGVYATALTASVCPARFITTSPVFSRSTLTVLSSLPDAKNSPDGETTTQLIPASCSRTVMSRGANSCGRCAHSSTGHRSALGLAASKARKRESSCDASGSWTTSWAASPGVVGWRSARMCLPRNWCSSRSTDTESGNTLIASTTSVSSREPMPDANMAVMYSTDVTSSITRSSSPPSIAYGTRLRTRRRLMTQLAASSLRLPWSTSGCAGTILSPAVSPGKNEGLCTIAASHLLYGFARPAHFPE